MTTCVNRVWSLIVCPQFFCPCSQKPLHFSITLLRLCLRAFNWFNCAPTKSRSLRKRQKTQGALLKIACNFCRRSTVFFSENNLKECNVRVSCICHCCLQRNALNAINLFALSQTATFSKKFSFRFNSTPTKSDVHKPL